MYAWLCVDKRADHCSKCRLDNIGIRSRVFSGCSGTADDVIDAGLRAAHLVLIAFERCGASYAATATCEKPDKLVIDLVDAGSHPSQPIDVVGTIREGIRGLGHGSAYR